VEFVKSIFHKFFAADKGDKTGSQWSLLLPAPPRSIHDNQKRALIGWIATRLGQKLQMDSRKAGLLIYASFTAEETVSEQTDDELQYLITLASCLVEWADQEEDVYLQIKGMKLSEDHHRFLLETYEETKQDIALYRPPLKKPEFVDHAEGDEIWQVYRDVIYAVTQRKFLLIPKSEVDRYKEGRVLCSAEVKERSDIPKARDLAKQSFQEIAVPSTAVMSYLLVISEAITNILKHAAEGRMTVVEAGDKIHVLVEDSGPGFPLKLLPKATLMAGYSTKKSLGQGFTLMMKMSEAVLLSTIPDEGSTLILILDRKEGTQSDDKQSIG
jgi:anti-sigma regulatory factor (Ser/Thr protein kinase)